MAFNKIVLLLVAALAAPIAVTQAAGGPYTPAWCVCSDNMGLTQTSCRLMGGNWDGGSCGVTSTDKWYAFQARCREVGGKGRCWI